MSAWHNEREVGVEEERRVSGVRASVADEFRPAGCCTVTMFTQYLHRSNVYPILALFQC